MKYKLINSVSKKETICDKVVVDGFDYYVSEGKPANGCVIYDLLDKRIWKVANEHCLSAYFEQDCKNWRVIIATTNPSIDLPKVADDEDIKEIHALSVLKKQDWDTSTNLPFNHGFIKGYNKSQETHPFSEEDMIEFAEWIQLCQWNFNGGTKTWWNISEPNNFPTTKELLQLWKEQKPKIVYYE